MTVTGALGHGRAPGCQVNDPDALARMCRQLPVAWLSLLPAGHRAGSIGVPPIKSEVGRRNSTMLRDCHMDSRTVCQKTLGNQCTYSLQGNLRLRYKTHQGLGCKNVPLPSRLSRDN